MGGYGRTFAAAAWDYGVDPRFSPAIAYAESSLGAYCFRPHNAWGWGNASWGSWEEAIYAHVAGLARGYGYTLTYDGALKYCPPNADYWYNTVAGQMAINCSRPHSPRTSRSRGCRDLSPEYLPVRGRP